MAMPQLLDAGLIEKNANPYKMEWMRRLVELFKREISYAREIVDYVKPFVNGPEDISEEAKAEMQEETALVVIKAFRDRVAAMDFMDRCLSRH